MEDYSPLRRNPTESNDKSLVTNHEEFNQDLMPKGKLCEPVLEQDFQTLPVNFEANTESAAEIIVRNGNEVPPRVTSANPYYTQNEDRGDEMVRDHVAEDSHEGGGEPTSRRHLEAANATSSSQLLLFRVQPSQDVKEAGFTFGDSMSNRRMCERCAKNKRGASFCRLKGHLREEYENSRLRVLPVSNETQAESAETGVLDVTAPRPALSATACDEEHQSGEEGGDITRNIVHEERRRGCAQCAGQRKGLAYCLARGHVPADTPAVRQPASRVSARTSSKALACRQAEASSGAKAASGDEQGEDGALNRGAELQRPRRCAVCARQRRSLAQCLARGHQLLSADADAAALAGPAYAAVEGPVEAGGVVEALFDDGVWYPGSVLRADAAAQCNLVRFADGFEDALPFACPDVRRPLGPAAAAAKAALAAAPRCAFCGEMGPYDGDPAAAAGWCGPERPAGPGRLLGPVTVTGSCGKKRRGGSGGAGGAGGSSGGGNGSGSGGGGERWSAWVHEGCAIYAPQVAVARVHRARPDGAWGFTQVAVCGSF